MDRKEAYAQIKKLNLAGDVQKKFGKNFTQVSTANLVAMIEGAKKGKKPATKETPAAKKPSTKKVEELRNAMEGGNYETKYKDTVKAVAKFLACLPEEVLNDAIAQTKTLTPEKIIEDIDFSNADIDKMFKR